LARARSGSLGSPFRPPATLDSKRGIRSWVRSLLPHPNCITNEDRPIVCQGRDISSGRSICRVGLCAAELATGFTNDRPPCDGLSRIESFAAFATLSLPY